MSLKIHAESSALALENVTVFGDGDFKEENRGPVGGSSSGTPGVLSGGGGIQTQEDPVRTQEETALFTTRSGPGRPPSTPCLGLPASRPEDGFLLLGPRLWHLFEQPQPTSSWPVLVGSPCDTHSGAHGAVTRNLGPASPGPPLPAPKACDQYRPPP